MEESVKSVKIRAYSPSQIVNKKRVIYPFTGKFKDSFGIPEKIAKWFITGPSYSGKSSFLFQLCNYLCQFGPVDYNSYEEGDSETVAEKIREHGLVDKDGKFRLLHKAPIHLFEQRLLKRNAALFAVVDSIQHGRIDKNTYIDFVDTFGNQRKGKSLLFVSHWVKTDLTKHVKHDCDIKIEVIGFVAHCESRYGGNKPYIIWEDGAKAYWGKKYKLIAEGKYWPGQKK